MKIGLSIIISFMIFLLTMSPASSARGETEPLPCDYKKSGLDSSKFYLYLTKDTPYTRWIVLPGNDKIAPGKESHGASATIYVNPVASRSIEGRAGMAFGSVIVLEEYDSAGRNIGLAVMIKIKGYNPVAGDWHWFHFAADGSTRAAGRVDACILCHSENKGNDYIMTTTVR
jgi:hypothetical protein